MNVLRIKRLTIILAAKDLINAEALAAITRIALIAVLILAIVQGVTLAASPINA